MSDVERVPTPEPMPDQTERDTFDDAQTYVLLDGHDVMLAVCKGCGFVRCQCEPYEPFTRAEYRQMAARYDAGPERYRP